MGKLVLTGRLVRRDLRHRPAQAALLLIAMTAATAVLTLALALHGVTSHPYAQTRAATNGPDVVAQIPSGTPGAHGPETTGRRGPTAPSASATEARILGRAPGVTTVSGPYPEAGAILRAPGLAA